MQSSNHIERYTSVPKCPLVCTHSHGVRVTVNWDKVFAAFVRTFAVPKTVCDRLRSNGHNTCALRSQSSKMFVGKSIDFI